MLKKINWGKMLNMYAAGGNRNIIKKGHNILGYYVKVKKQSPHHDIVTVENVYCTKEQYNELTVNATYNIYYYANPYINFGILETYRHS